MRDHQYVLAIEIGTTSCKSFVFRTDGSRIAASAKEHPTYYPHPGWAEQDPSDWWNAVKETTREVLARSKNAGVKISTVAVTGQMHSAVPVDASGEPLYNCIILTDRRSLGQCRKVEERISRASVHEITGNRLDPYITAPKLLWLKEEKPDLFKKMRKLLPPKDFIRFKLTGEFLVDHIEASGTLLYDIRKREWSPELFDIFQIPVTCAPEIRNSTLNAGEVTGAASRETGIGEGVPVIVGGADDVDILGTGALKIGSASCHLASTGEIVALTERPVSDPLGRVECYPHVIENVWLVGGPTSAAGTALRWFRDNFAQDVVEKSRATNESPYKILDSEAANSTAGSVLFLPYLLGERCPLWDPTVTGVFFGLKTSHTRTDIYKSILEGVAFSLRDITTTIQELGVDVDHLMIADGGAHSSLWRQIIADVIGKPLYFTGIEESASFGSMILAAVNLGIYPTIEEACGQLVHTKTVNQPNPTAHAKYTTLFEIYKKIYRSLGSEFNTLTQLNA